MVGAERRAGLVECECAQSVATEEAIVATDLPRLHVPCCQLPRPLLHDSTTGRAQAKRAGTPGATPESANRTLFGASPQIPPNGPKTSLPARTRPRILGGFRGRSVGEGVRMQILVTGVSGYVGAALAPALAGEGHRRARLRALARARGGGRRGARRARDRRRADRRRARGGDGRRRGRLLPDPLDGGRGRRRVPRAGAPRRRALRRRRAGGRRAPRRLPRRARAARGRRLAPPRLAARGRGVAAVGGARVDRAARLDRDRRPLALVPLPRAADRAAAGAGAARVAAQPHAPDRRARRASPSCAPPPTRPPRSPAARGTSRARTP